MLLLLGKDLFSVEKMHKFDVFNECVTQPTDQPTDGQSLLKRCEDASKNEEKSYCNSERPKTTQTDLKCPSQM